MEFGMLLAIGTSFPVLSADGLGGLFFFFL
jgi:hypothetical protein